MASNEYGCAISHIRLWRHLIESGLPAICVFEDDAVIERAFDMLPLPDDADFVFLNDRVSGLMPDDIEGDHAKAQWLETNPFPLMIPGCGMDAYIVTAEGARKALELTERLFLPIDLQIMAYGQGSSLVNHSLVECRAVEAPELALYVSKQVYANNEDCGVSYLHRTKAYPKIQFGSGGCSLPGWFNCDLPEYDITHPLRLASESSDYLFAEHVIEHVTPREVWSFVVECRRILKPGGVLRLAFPDIGRILRAETGVFDALCGRNGWSDGTREGSVRATLFCHGHLGAWTADSLGTVLRAVGFEVTECRPGESLVPELRGLEQHWRAVGHEVNNLETTVLEARKLPVPAPV